MERAAALREAQYGNDPAELADSLNDLAIEVLEGCSVPPAIRDQSERLLRRVVALSMGAYPDLQAAALESLSRLSRDRGAWNDAEGHARQALEIEERLHGPAHPIVLDALLPLAAALVDLGRYGEAERLYERALGILGRPRPDSFGLLARVYNETGELARVADRVADAEEAFERARAFGLRAFPEDDLFFAILANNLAGLSKDQGEYHRAESRLRQSLDLRRASPQTCPIDLADAKLNLAEVYRAQGSYDRARPYYEEALDEAVRALGEEHPDLATFYNQHALFYAEQELLGEAAAYYEVALRLTRSAAGDRHPLAAMTLHDLADLAARSGRHAEAQGIYRQALAIREEVFGPDHPDVAVTLTGLASSLLREGKPGEALEAAERALAILEPTRSYPEAEAETYELRAEIRRHRRDPEGALADLRTSLEIVEELRPRTGGSEPARARFLARYTDWFHRMIEWEIEAGRLDLAFEVLERSRARVLVDQLLAVRLDILGSVPDPERRRTLARRQEAARAGLAETRRRITVHQAGGAPRRPGASLSALLVQRERAEQELQEVEGEIRSESPLWQLSARSGSISLARVQARLVPRDGLVLFYDIGPERSFLFVIPPAGREPEVHPLQVPAQAAAVLGMAAGPLTRGALERGLLGSNGRGGLLRLLGEHPSRSRTGLAARQETLAAGLHALWQVLVPAAVRERALGSSQVVLIPDGPLHRLPFEALIVATGARGFADAAFWLDRGPPLRYAASATSLAALEERARAEGRDATAGPSILSVSDPVFSRQGGAGTAVTEARLSRERYERAGGALIRLPSTASETSALVEVFGGAGAAGDVLALQREQAEEGRVRAELAGKRYIHLATHGLVDEGGGELFAALALTPPARGGATPDNDGFLQLNEIYPLKLDCRLAVLSACRTAFGAPHAGEGVFSLARGFLVAGSRRVVASLWQVSDEATARLMGDYFRRIADMELRGRRPLYVDALSTAKKQLRQGAAWSDPYFWAPFVLSGEE